MKNKQTEATSHTENSDSHKKAAAHHIEAAKQHLEAAKSHEAADHHVAARNMVLAYGHSAIAGEFLNDDARHHAQKLKEIKHQ